MDGARIFNASTASGVPVKEYAKLMDSVMFCLSKGLSAPVGSMLVGPKGFHRLWAEAAESAGRGNAAGRRLGRGRHHRPDRNAVDRLKEDHLRAKTLARAIAGLPGISLDPRDDRDEYRHFRIFSSPLYGSGVPGRAQRARRLALAPGGGIRFVTHKDVDDEDVERAIGAFQRDFMIRSASARQQRRCL